MDPQQQQQQHWTNDSVTKQNKLHKKGRGVGICIRAASVSALMGMTTLTLVSRGAVKIWKPQVTPLSELRPQELNTIKTATGEEIQAVQKTSLAINTPQVST